METYYDVGDVVMLNSEGPPMTVKASFYYEDEEGEEVGQGVTCQWFVDGEVVEEDFDICMVHLILSADEFEN